MTEQERFSTGTGPEPRGYAPDPELPRVLVVVDPDVTCYCGVRRWVRGQGQGGTTLVWCDVCGCVVDMVSADA